MRTNQKLNGFRLTGGASINGFTLVELMVVVVIVGVLAALAIPSFITYTKNARLSEATSNIQGILEAEQAYFTRFQQYTSDLPNCPSTLPTKVNSSQVWPDPPDVACGQGWGPLGWKPDGAVYFRYQVFSSVDAVGNSRFPNRHPTMGGVPGGMNTFGVNWDREIGNDTTGNLNNMQPWCAVQAEADTDLDNDHVFFRSNSYNQHVYRFPDPISDHPTW